MDDVVGIATLIAVCVAVFQLAQVRKQRARAFEDAFVHRYWQINDRLTWESHVRMDGPVDPRDKLAAVAFFDLVENELEMRRVGWISDDTWSFWASDTVSQLSAWPHREVWSEVIRARPDAYPGILRMLDSPTPTGFDPCEIPNWRRRFTAR